MTLTLTGLDELDAPEAYEIAIAHYRSHVGRLRKIESEPGIPQAIEIFERKIERLIAVHSGMQI